MKTCSKCRHYSTCIVKMQGLLTWYKEHLRVKPKTFNDKMLELLASNCKDYKK